MKRSSGLRTIINLSESVERTLNMYALAAGAAGVSTMVLVSPSQAEIVYTPTHQVTAPQQVLSIDLNHDGIKDFGIVTSYAEGSSFWTNGGSSSANMGGSG